ncbi:hypothetical protein [Streptomyces sp. TP-A0874]|uniref:hypothetical protein n=1 Tax=Streptomyces sp. TP-A0874 TaxID=549819 RepID=UPI000852A8C2|nr:hypothetical protein [Streptomyces sp. TP-A0874]
MSIAFALLAWLVIGFFRDPPSSWMERYIVGLLAFCFAVPVILTRGYRKTLPALDRTPRRATVTGRRGYNTDPDPESEIGPYELLTVTLDINGTAVESTIADIVAPDSLDRFTVGSIWTVYAFEDPAALNKDADRTRVILTEAHDDVIRSGYDLGFYSLHDGPGPGSDLLLRRFANDRR